jgi:biotin transport system substrate-specific component
MQTANTSEAASQSRAALPIQLDAFSHTLTGKAVIVVAASLFVAVCAHLVVPLPFTPVPLTLADLAVLLVGLALGPRMAFAALALYLAEGAAGLPVFAPTDPGGIAHLVGATGGYLFAYPFAAALASGVVRTFAKLPRYAAAFIACLVATAVIMTSGAAWLGIYTHHAAALTLKLAVLPFLPGQTVKVIAAAGIYASIASWRRA